MLRYWPLSILGIACFAPAALRLLTQAGQAAGLFSDCLLGLGVFLLAWAGPRWLRIPLVLAWAVFQVCAQELFFSLQRFPVWQDLHYLGDADFVKNSTVGFKFSFPLYALFQLGSAFLLALLPLRRLSGRVFAGSLAVLTLLFFAHARWPLPVDGEQNLTTRYNALHWLVLDTIRRNFPGEGEKLTPAELPAGLRQADLQGKPLLAERRAKNVLLIVLEGIPGLYLPEIRQAMGIEKTDVSMDKLAAGTEQAMLIPDFTVHSHQTIRGLYAMLCGDFSKFSWNTPKAIELQALPGRAHDCLPAQLREHGWSTHYLQAASLGFMSKDRFMPLVGFEQVHGVEWFSESNPFPFEWGMVDSAFFQGARRYIKGLNDKGSPWMLTLLTVGTHQPYAVTDAIAARYPSRKAATVALLDEAVGTFLKDLRRDGVLENTLVLVTSDESHGSELAPWVSAWGLGMVLGPDKTLPRMKKGGYGLVDVTASVLDYFDLPVPASVLGRSFFRDYDLPREMLSYTASTLRWHTGDGMRYECSDDGRCLGGPVPSLLGEPPRVLQTMPATLGKKAGAIARTLDSNLSTAEGEQVFSFAAGEQRQLSEGAGNDWNDNLVGAQYLDFPAHSDVEVKMRLTVLQAPEEGLQLKLLVKEWEYDQGDMNLPELPVVHRGETLERSFSFHNNQARQSFSFFLVGSGAKALVRIDQFDVVVRTDSR